MANEVILLVEDDIELADIMMRALRRHGYHILPATDGEDALRVIRERVEMIDLVITDIVMPGMGGRELVWRLRQLCSEVKVILLSGYTDVDGALQTIESGPSIFLQKPVDLGVLANTIRGMLDQPV